MTVSVRVGSRYLARTVIGHGSYGTVFRADGPDGAVAVKLLRTDLARNPEVLNRFLRERSVLLRLDHSGIVRVRDLVAEGDVLALVMDLVEGHDLRGHLTSQGALLPLDAARLVSEVAAALSYAHGQGVVHRDVKPENILLHRGRPLLTDFGIARLVATAATVAGQVLGTPAYLAPELASGGAATPASDVYACGVLLYELVAGHPPFVADHPLSVVHQHVTDTPRRPSAIPEELWRVVAACLAKQPADRPDADTLRLLLTEWAARPTDGRHAGTVGPQDTGGFVARHASPEETGHRMTEVVERRDSTPDGYQTRPVPVTNRFGTRVLPAVTSPAPTGSAASGPPGSTSWSASPATSGSWSATPATSGSWSASPASPTSQGRARIEPPPPTGAPEPDWQPAPAQGRTGSRLLYAAALVAVAAVFFASGYWMGDAGRPAAPAATPSAAASESAPASAEPTPQPRYLSEMPFVQVANGWGPVEINKSIGNTAPDDGGPLVMAGTTYERGLGVHAPSHVRIYPPKGCGQLAAVVGIDASSTGPDGGTVVFQVVVDGQVRYDSGIVTRNQPKPIEVDVAGAGTVDLIVTDGGDGPNWDMSDWADARLICRS